MLYMLTGSIWIDYLIKKRRLVYLHHILNQDEDSLLRTFFDHQLKTRKTKDWATQVLKDITHYQIDFTMEEIRKTPKATWKSLIKKKTIELALEFLNSNQGSKSRKSSELKMVKCLCPNNEDITIKIASFIALVQTHMIENVKNN